jgi:hypothetical protein
MFILMLCDRFLVAIPLDISFPCSTSSIASRMFMSTKATTPILTSTDTKPIRLNRARLPASTISSGNIINTVSTFVNEQKVIERLVRLCSIDSFAILFSFVLFLFLDNCGYVYWHSIDSSCFSSVHDILIPSPSVFFNRVQQRLQRL